MMVTPPLNVGSNVVRSSSRKRSNRRPFRGWPTTPSRRMT